ncbi:MAG: histidine phosphatase family protein [Verrucomicrobia bacterium]|nr:histidine phosphatase family protein [Verrucomicrobiota bacterium]
MNIAADLASLAPWREGRNIVVFLRHGERESVPSHEFPRHDAPLTDDGKRAAESLGMQFGARLGSVRSSPVPRCVETARALLVGAGKPAAPHEDRLLGDPGAFVLDGDRAMATLVDLGFHPAAKRLGEGERLPGFVDPDAASRQMLALAVSLLVGGPPGVHVLVTHDLILSTLVARVWGRALAEAEWPGYLHGAALWMAGGSYVAQYSTMACSIPGRLVDAAVRPIGT